MDHFAECVVDVCMSIHEFPYCRYNANDPLGLYVAEKAHSYFTTKVRDNQAFWFHGMQKATSRAEMFVFGRFQDCFSPMIANATTGYLVYQHNFDFNRATKTGDGVLRSTTFMHHDYNHSTMPRELDETEERLTPLSSQVARLWNICRDLPFTKVTNLVQGYAFAGDEVVRRELEECRQSARVRLEQVLLACEKAAKMDIQHTYESLLSLQHKIVTGHAVVDGVVKEISQVRCTDRVPITSFVYAVERVCLRGCRWVSQEAIVDEMCSLLPFVEAEGGIGALLKSSIITLYLLRYDHMTHHARNELLALATITGSDYFLPQNVPKYLVDMNHYSPAKNLPVSKLVNTKGQFVPFIVGCANDALLGMIPATVYPYVNEPPPGFEPFNPEASLAEMIPQDLLRANVDPMLVIVVVGGLSFHELQEIDKLVRKTKRKVLCIAMDMVTGSAYMTDIFVSG